MRGVTGMVRFDIHLQMMKLVQVLCPGICAWIFAIGTPATAQAITSGVGVDRTCDHSSFASSGDRFRILVSTYDWIASLEGLLENVKR